MTWLGLGRPWSMPGLFRAGRRHICFLAVGFVWLTVTSAGAVEPRERLANPTLEARARSVSAELRCLVCQNESIDDSNADLAHDIRVLVRERLTAGDTNLQATQAIVTRYGAFVLLRPPVQPATYALWFAPPVLVVSSLAGLAFWLRRRPAGAGLAPLSAAERQRLDRLLGEKEG